MARQEPTETALVIRMAKMRATTQREAQIWQAERAIPRLERPKMR